MATSSTDLEVTLPTSDADSDPGVTTKQLARYFALAELYTEITRFRMAPERRQIESQRALAKLTDHLGGNLTKFSMPKPDTITWNSTLAAYSRIDAFLEVVPQNDEDIFIAMHAANLGCFYITMNVLYTIHQPKPEQGLQILRAANAKAREAINDYHAANPYYEHYSKVKLNI